MYIDTHCHLNFHSFESDLDEVINRANKVGVEKIIIPSAKIDSSEKAIEIAQKYPNCFAAVGIHPHHAIEESGHGLDTVKAKLIQLANNSCVVAIGEIGMDYHHYKNSPAPNDESRTIQKELFILQLEVAFEKQLPVIIHCRWAQTDVFNIISEFIRSKPLLGVFHCFDGSTEYLKSVLNLGFYIGFDGNSTYPENTHLQNLIKTTPLDRIFLETDSPFLTPNSHRRQRNEPLYLPEIAQLIANLHKTSLKSIETITSSNASKLFLI